MMDLLGWENWRNWTDQFEQKHAHSWTQADILGRVKKLETLHWRWCAVGSALSALGGALCGASVSHSALGGGALTVHATLGCAGFILGFLVVTGTKLASSISLCTFHILWDIAKRDDEALRQSEIEDL